MELGQPLFNTIFGVAAFFGGWAMKNIWDKLKELSSDTRELTTKVHGIEVLVAGDYVRKDDFEKFEDRVIGKLERIEGLIADKEDRVRPDGWRK